MSEDERAYDTWDGYAVAVSFLLAFMGAYSTVCLAEQYRISQQLQPKLVSKGTYLLLMATSMGGGAMWCMHFVGLAGHSLHDEKDVEIHVKFDIIESVLSLITCVVFVYAGLYISSRDKMFSRDKEEIFKLIVEEAKNDSLKSVRSKKYLLKVALFRGLTPLLLGGVITGGGFCITHYLGMLAIHADVLIHWHIGTICASVIIAVIAATSAFWILFRLLALYPGMESLRILSSFMSSIAMCGMHYTGMLSATYTVDRNPPDAVFGYLINQHKADLIVTGAAVLNTLFVSMVVQAELRSWHLYVHARLKASRKVLDQLRDRYPSDPVLHDFESKDKKLSSTHEVSRRSTFQDGAYSSLTGGTASSFRNESKVHVELFGVNEKCDEDVEINDNIEQYGKSEDVEMADLVEELPQY